ncbi:MAG: HD domain-containing protein [Candidatus Omnitrophica bacterium]|jgi:putative nucleotidyltransferase with HDIG domain|nr:HD domain-containing protein [Candidatus Omnitrophota bacterium]
MKFDKNKFLLEFARQLAFLCEQRIKFCHGHAVSVCNISMLIGNHMKLGKEKLRKLQLSALLHDVGKIAVRDTILNKATSLELEEYEEVKKHALLGAEMIKKIKALEDISGIVRQHHEHFDGMGYPDCLKKEKILIQARIISVADAFDVITSVSSYRKPLSRAQALAEIEHNARRQFDPQVVCAFKEVCNTAAI